MRSTVTLNVIISLSCDNKLFHQHAYDSDMEETGIHQLLDVKFELF